MAASAEASASWAPACCISGSNGEAGHFAYLPGFYYIRIFRSITVKNLYLAPILSALLLSACTSASGPTFSAYELQPRDGIRTYQVDCHGIFSSQAMCMKVATRMCADQPVRAVDSTRPLRDGADPGTLVFQCGAAAGAAASAPAPVAAAAPAPVQNVNLSSDALFAFGSATLTPAARATLDKLTSSKATRTSRAWQSLATRTRSARTRRTSSSRSNARTPLPATFANVDFGPIRSS